VKGETFVTFYGGLKGEDSVKEIYQFEIESSKWTKSNLTPVENKGKEISARDDHASCIIMYENEDFGMMAIGGFVDGSRTNSAVSIRPFKVG